jgi:ribosomal protein S18 acetylase RimI-like enzyme
VTEAPREAGGEPTQIGPAMPEDLEGCVDVLAELPEFFTPDTHQEVRERWATARSWTACRGREVVGFVLLEQRYPSGAEILYAAVRPAAQRRGIGAALVGAALAAAGEAGVLLVEVKTLDASSGYEPYRATRAFWEGQGFVQVDCIDPLPGWDPGNPSAIYVAALGSTRPAS